KEDTGLDSVKWFLNNIELNFTSDEWNYQIYSAGEVNFKVKGYVGDGCELVLDSTVSVAGERIGISVIRSFGCVPITFTLNDSFWNDTTGERYWVIDGDTVPSLSFSTVYVLKGLRDT